MYCTSCGASCPDDSKFCGDCGKRMNVSADDLPQLDNSPEIRAQAEVFFQDDGIVVNSAVFTTNDGASFPIRNISSVVVEQKPANVFAIGCGLILSVVGLLGVFSGFMLGFIFILISLPFWNMAVNRPYRLVIGAGGVLQIAIERSRPETLEVISVAIKSAIVAIQRGS